MSEINRITPAEVLAAYEATKLVPIQEIWAEWWNGKPCGCGLTAVYAHRNPGGHDDINENENETEAEFLSKKLGIEMDYLRGFLGGFDGHAFLEIRPDIWKIGYEDGSAAWEAVKHLVPVSPNEN